MSKSPASGSRTRALGLIISLVALIGALVLASIAMGGTSDPLSGGSAKLSLKLKGLTFSPKTPSLTVTGGNVDPTSMTGNALTTGKTTIKVKGGTKKVKTLFTQITLTGGGAGSIDAKVGSAKVAKCLTFSGGTPGRSGFDGTVSNGKLKLSSKCAKKIKSASKAKSVKSGSVGKLSSLNTTPSADTIVSGTASLTFDPIALGKLNKHGVDLQVAAPATETKTGTGGSLTAVTYTLPVIGGTISPSGTSGQIKTGGTIILKKTANSESSSTLTCSASGAEIDVANSVFDLSTKTVNALATLKVPGNPDSVIQNAPLATVQSLTMTVDPNTRAANGSGSLVNTTAGAGSENVVMGNSATAVAQGGPCNTAANDFAPNGSNPVPDPIGQAPLALQGQ